MPLLQKGNTLDPTVVSPAQTLAAATSAGAQALGYPDLGMLKAGYLADLILLDIHVPHMAPMTDWEANLIYAAQGSDVRLTMVDGRVLYRDGEFTTLNRNALLLQAQAGAQTMRKRLAAQ